MKALEVLFWISLFIVFYTYIGYGILLYILVKIKECFRKPAPRPMPADDALPPLTLFIAAYNEEDVVDEKMHNCLELDYPADKLRILWVTDGSNDHTNERLSHWPQAIVLHQPQRQGKTAALNRGIHFVETPLVVFTDANTHLNREALREIVHAFTDPKVGCVAGEKRIAVQSKDNAASGGEGLYWKYESTLKALDARLYSAVGAAGELFAVRRELFEEMQTDTLLDDFILSLRIVMQGHTIAYCANAYAVESGSQGAHRCRGLAVHLAAASVAQPIPLRHILFPIYFPPGAALVAHSYPIVPIASPQHNSHLYDKHAITVCHHLAVTSSFLPHGKLGVLPFNEAYKKQDTFHPLLFPLHERQRHTRIQLPAQAQRQCKRRMGEGQKGMKLIL
jgi:hypothetical protein